MAVITKHVIYHQLVLYIAYEMNLRQTLMFRFNSKLSLQVHQWRTNVAPYRGTPGSKFTKFEEQVSIGQTTNAVKLRRAETKMRKIYPFSKFFDSPWVRVKLVQTSPKSLKTCYGPMPVVLPNFIVLGQTM